MKIRNIIEGWLNYFRKVPPEQEALFRDRFRICQTNECGKLKLGICMACGCPVSKKTRALDEDCPENMWYPRLYVDETGCEFIDVNEIPEELQDKFSWIIKEDMLRGQYLTSGEWVYTWQDWLDFKEILRRG